MNPANVLPQLVRIDAGALADGLGTFASPAAILVELLPGTSPSGWHNRVLAVGRPADIDAHPASRSPGLRTVSRPDCVLFPGLVNAHTHLDLTHLGPRPFDPEGGFVGWVEMVRQGRHAADEDIADSVTRGLEMSLASGTVAIGDIAGAPAGRPSLVPWQTMRRHGIRGVSYLEFFAIGNGLERGLAAVQAAIESVGPGDRLTTPLGLQPHAPNTVDLLAYERSIRHARQVLGPDVRFATHLAETPEELRFTAHAEGPQRQMLERLGIWNDSTLERIGRGLHPVAHLAGVLVEAGSPLVAAHVHAADDRAIQTLADAGTSVAYCPRASEYFGAPGWFGPHRYRDMLAAGVNVALGTDSIVNLPAGPPGARLSVLEEARFLYARDRTDPVTLLRMATVNGAQALGVDIGAFGFRGPSLAGLLAVPAERGARSAGDSPHTAVGAALDAASVPELLFADTYCGLTGTITQKPV